MLSKVVVLLLVFLSIELSFCSVPNNRTKYVLLYTSLAKPNPNWHLPSDVGGKEYFERINCPETNCIVTSNKHFLPDLRTYDAIALNSWDIHSMDTFPPPETRHPEQIYLVYYHESPSRTQSLGNYSNVFNWTMSYMLNADVVIPYAHVIDKRTRKVIAPSLDPNWRPVQLPTETTKDPFVRELVKGKTKMAAWFVSSCYSPSQRKFVVKNIQEYFPVDVFGKCGNLTCPKEDRGHCKKMVETDYKFYFSFENSLCQDYVTEKVFETMNYFVIPVVFGGADYSRFLPPHSYINALDFESVEDLVEYLVFVANDLDDYMSYFWWKDFYKVGRALDFCPLCKKLNEKGDKSSTVKYYSDLDNWFKNGTCKEPEEVPLIRKTLIHYKRIKG